MINKKEFLEVSLKVSKLHDRWHDTLSIWEYIKLNWKHRHEYETSYDYFLEKILNDNMLNKV